MLAHTYTPHTSTTIHLQPQSHVYCLCKFVFPCSGNYQQVFLLPFALLNIGMLMHTHPHMHRHKPTCTCTHTHMHMHTHSCTHTLEYASITNICAYARIKIVLAVIHHTTHTHTHTHTLVNLCLNYYLLSFVAMCTFRCEPVVIQECTLMHTGMHAQARTLTQTNKHTHTHKYKPPTLVDTILLTLVPPA